MWKAMARGLIVIAAVMEMTCAPEVTAVTEDRSPLVKRIPIGISSEAAWSLFDRSIDSGFAPPTAPVVVNLDEVSELAAIKVYGPAPYGLRVTGSAGTSLGFAPMDLSQTSRGWHAFPASTPTPTSIVELHFEPIGGPGAVPEIELWSVEDAPRPRITNLSAEELPKPFTATKAHSPIDIEPGYCAAFSVALTHRPELFRRAFITYQASNVLRGFGIKRSVNGLGEHGGSWLPRAGATEVVDEIDPQSLRPGTNDVSLCVPDHAARRTTIDRLRIIGELDLGVDVASSISLGGAARDGAVLRDADPATTVQLAALERVLVAFDRLIAPDALRLAGQIHGAVSVACVERDGIEAPIDVRQHGEVFVLDGGARRCAQLAITVDEASTLADLDVVGSGAAERVDWPRLVVTSAREHFGEVAWIGGFVARPRVMTTAIRVRVAGEDVGTRTGDFGRLVTRGHDATAMWRVPVTAAFPDGTTGMLDVLLDLDRHQDLVSAQASAGPPGGPGGASASANAPQVGQAGEVAIARASRRAATKIRLGTRVGVDVPAGAVGKPTDITVRHLGEIAVPPLDTGMINVTGPKGHAYEFLPHGQRFARPVEIVLPYDPALIPEGMTPNDINTYFFDPKAERWVKLPRRAVDIGERVTRSLTEHFTIMINAVLAVPRNPTPLSHDPTALTSIGAASPAANIDFIEPPTPSSMGDARVSLPIRLPEGRGAHTPTLGIAYSSGGGNGWLGLGWDLAISRVEIDTRFGVPTYAPDEEPRYLLDGEALVPTDETEGPGCEGGAPGRRYRSRVEGAFTHILRCGSGPTQHRFELTDRDGTRYIHGGAGASLVAPPSTDPQAPPAGAVSRWALSEVVDRYGNTTRYRYHVDELTGSGTEPSRELYPSAIEYTSHPSLPMAPYRVEFELDDGMRPDRTISGRAGFKTLTRHLLRAVHVKLGSESIRSYVLTYAHDQYAHGQFGKSVLSSIRVYGVGGCAATTNAFVLPACGGALFHQHRFDYHQEEQALAPPVAWRVDDAPEPAEPALVKGRSTTISGAISVDLGDGVVASAGGGGGARDELIGMYDVDGNGLVDQVFRSSSGMRVLYNQSRPGIDPATDALFAAVGPAVDGVTGLGHEIHASWNVGLKVGSSDGGFGPAVGAGFSSSITRADRLFGDINGDGFVDLMKADGDSLLGAPCPSGICFTPVEFAAISAIDPRQDPILAAIAAEVAARLFTGDPVVQWTAPFSGRIAIAGTTQKVRAGGTDGVTVELYHQDTRVEGLSLSPDQTAPIGFPAPRTIDVMAGEALYIRVQTGSDEGIAPDGTLHDLVDARLGVRYERICDGLLRSCEDIADPFAARDPTGRAVFAFDSRDDFRIAGTPAPVAATAKGVLELDARLVHHDPAADLRACVQRFPAPTETFTPDLDTPCSAATNVSGTFALLANTAGTQVIDMSIPVELGELLVLRVESDLSFDPADVTLEPATPGAPLVAYSTVCPPNETGGFDCTDDPAAVAGVPLPVAHFGPFFPLLDASPTTPRLPFVVPLAGQLDITPPPMPGGQFLYAIRSDRQGLIAQHDCRLVSCGMLPHAVFAVTAGESVTIELLTTGSSGLPSWVDVELDSVPGFAPLIVRSFGSAPLPWTPFAGGFHGWRAAIWNDREAFAPASLLDDWEDPLLTPERRKQVARSIMTPRPVFTGSPLTESLPAWIGPHSAAFIRGDGLHAALIGAIPSAGAPADRGGVFAGDYARLSATGSYFFGADLVSGTLASVDAQLSLSSTTTTTEVIDLDGDGVTDVIGNTSIKGAIGTLLVGNLPGFSLGVGVRKRRGVDYSVGFGVEAVTRETTAGGRTLRVTSDEDPESGLGFSVAVGIGIGRTQTLGDLVDVNGDGLPDRVARRGAGVFVRYNLGQRFGVEESFGIVDSQLQEPIDALDALERSAPIPLISLDTTSDALQHDTTITQTRTKKIDLLLVSASSSTVKTSSRTTKQLADINGDGLPDLLFKRDGQPIRVQLNRGGDFGPAVEWGTPDWSIGGEPIELASSFDQRVTTLGVGGADVLAGTGSQSGSAYSAQASIPGVGGVSASNSEQVDSYEMALVDVDGDGTADHVLRRAREGDPGTVYVKRNRVTGRANLLHRVHRPLGGTITLDYARVGNTTDMPQSRQVLARIEVDDGVDLGTSFASPNLVTQIAYEDGFHHRGEKQFFGFAKVRTQRADGVTVEAEYENRTYPLHGRLVREARRDGGGTLLHERRMTHEVLPVTDADAAPVGAHADCLAKLHPLLTTGACIPLFPVVVREDEIRAEGGTTTKTRVVRDLERDRLGNVLASIDQADDALASDDLHTRATYANDTTRWILGRPTSLTVRGGSASGALLRARSATYNAQGDPLAIAVETGAGTATTQLGYDVFGNLHQVATPPNHAGQVQTFSVDYDDETRTYPTRTTDGFGYTARATYDLRFGVATSEIDVNGVQLQRTLDPFGRLQTARGPYDTTLPALSFEYLPDASPPRAITTTRASAPADYTGPVPAPITTVTVTDGLARAIQLRKTAVVDGVAGMTTTGSTSRDAVGRVTTTYHPFFTPGASTSFVSPAITPAMRTAYDALDRTVSTQHPDGATETATFDLVVDPGGTALLFQTRTTDANGHAREILLDHADRTRTFVEHPTPTAPSITRYGYLATGELSRIDDAEGNQTRLGYDLRGLRTSFDNPDYGLIEDRYDLMGNRIALIEPNHRAIGAEVRYLYDRNRLARIDYPSKPDVTFVYGAPCDAGVPCAPSFRAGRLAEVHDETGSQAHFYGALGEARRTLRTVRDPAHPSYEPKIFDTRFTTDSLGRMLRIGYPDGEQVTHTYDAAGALVQVIGSGAGYTRTYADELRYDVFGNRTRARSGNGVVSTWSFAPLRVRLASVVTTLPSAAKVQDLRYSYDPGDNPTRIENVLPPPPSHGRLPGGSSVTFTYDGVDRLVRALGQAPLAQGHATTYDQTFAYSASHNLLDKQRVHLLINHGGNAQQPNATNFVSAYTYGVVRPHLPTRVGDLELVYDPSGNPITRHKVSTGSIQQLTWDDDGRLVQVSGMGANQRNVYDASGLRVIRSGQDGDTVFASPYFDLANNNTGTKHVFAGAMRVASVLRAFTSSADPPPPSSAGTAFYFHLDHLGSTGVVTAQDGTVNDAHAYFPDGEIWIDAGPRQPINGYLFSGKQLDIETGLYDFGQRFYDPRLSLWLGTDPLVLDDAPGVAIGQPVMLAPGAYAAHNPQRFIDPDGRGPLEWIGRKVRVVGRFARDEIAPRAFGAMKVGVGAAGFVVGAGLCETGLGCVAGAPLMGISVDVAASGGGQMIIGTPQPTVVGRLVGPTAQTVEEGIVDAVGVVGIFRALAARGAGRTLSESVNQTESGGIRTNAARGRAYEAQVAGEMQADGWTVAREVTLETPGGARTRMDIIGTRGNTVRCVECKSSTTAPLTPRQQVAHPQIEAQGATVMGKGKPSVPGGTQIPPTRVEIRRPLE